MYIHIHTYRDIILFYSAHAWACTCAKAHMLMHTCTYISIYIGKRRQTAHTHYIHIHACTQTPTGSR